MKTQHLYTQLALILTIPMLLLTGCQTPAYFGMPTQRFELPETSGQWKGSIDVQHNAPVFVVTVKDISATPPGDSGSVITRTPSDYGDIDPVPFTSWIVHSARIGLFDWLDVSIAPSLGEDVATFYRAKAQLIGAPRNVAKKGNFSLSLGVGVASGGNSEGSGVDDDGYTSEVSFSAVEKSLLMGYRFHDQWITYLNFTHLNFKADTDIDQHPNGNPSTLYTYSGEGEQILGILGIRVQFKWGGYTGAEATYSRTEWETAEVAEYGTFGGIFGWAWGGSQASN